MRAERGGRRRCPDPLTRPQAFAGAGLIAVLVAVACVALLSRRGFGGTPLLALSAVVAGCAFPVALLWLGDAPRRR